MIACTVKAWFERKPELARQLATYDRVNDRIVGLPKGWPKGTNAREYIDRFLNARRDRQLALFQGREPKA